MPLPALLWVGLAFIVAHNLEEWVTMGSFLDAHRNSLPALLAAMTAECFAVSLVVVMQRELLEKELYNALGRAAPELPQPLRPASMSAEARLDASNERERNAARAWGEWRDKQTLPLDVLKARSGQGPGASVYREYRESRAAVQESMKDLGIERGREKDLGDGHGFGR